MSDDFFDVINSRISDFDAESSYHFLKNLFHHQNWHCYSSDNFGLSSLETLIRLFVRSHAHVNLVNTKQNSPNIFSLEPLGIFRYRMDSNNFWQEIGYLNKYIGYIVEGAYWSNGFFYKVIDEKKFVELKLCVDETTFIRYNYPPVTK